MARRRPGSLFPLEFSILDSGLILQATEGSFYGFALAKQLAGTAGSSLTAHGTLYKSLARLVELGILEASWEVAAIAEAEGRPRRRLYTVTGEGEQAHARALAAALATETPPLTVPALPQAAQVGLA
jgi:DNA-binding PadR family transcriptional regulator